MESHLDGGARCKLVVEVLSARVANHENACVELNFNGQRHRTTVKQSFFFDVSDPSGLAELALEAYVYDVAPSMNRTYSFLGKVTVHGIPFVPLSDARVMHYPLCCQPEKRGRFSYIGTGTLSLKVYTIGDNLTDCIQWLRGRGRVWTVAAIRAQDARIASLKSASTRLCVKVVTAIDLMPKEEQGSASAFVVLAFDSWQVRTSTKFKDVNPVWDESFCFDLPDHSNPHDLVLEASVYSVVNRSSVQESSKSFLGKVRLCVSPHSSDPHVMYYPLEKNGVLSREARGLLGLKLSITHKGASIIRAREPSIASLHSTEIRLCVEVVSAHDLTPKDEQGSASAFVVLTFDHCQFRTAVKEKDLNPVWNEHFYFNVWDPSNLPMLDINAYVYHVDVGSVRRSKTLLGRVRIDGSLWGPFPDAILRHYPLSKHSMFSHVKGDLSLRVYTIYDPSIATSNPSPPLGDAVLMHYPLWRPFTFSHVKGLKFYTSGAGGPSMTTSNPFPPKPEKPRTSSHVKGKGNSSPKVYTIDDLSITTSSPSPPIDSALVYTNDNSIRPSNTSPQIDSAVCSPDLRLSNSLERKLQKQCSRPQVPLQHLKEITDNFSDKRILGQGGFGVVYKGVLQNGKMIAVKRIKSSFMPGMQTQFENEVCHLMMLKHPNIVRCMGYCYETRNECLQFNGKYVFAEMAEMLLCLEYLPKGSLDKYISVPNADESSGLDWSTRYKIIEGVCYGLCHLHEENNRPIVHLDLKPANILLDDGMVPKITDFGLSRSLDQTICTKSCDGTFGYMAPEFLHGGTITPKSDIFSLGVIIMEIVTGHRDYPDVTRTSSNDFIKLVLNSWRSLLQTSTGCGSLQTYCQQIEICLHVGLICVNPDRTKRPPIRKVISMLQGSESIDYDILC